MVGMLCVRPFMERAEVVRNWRGGAMSNAFKFGTRTAHPYHFGFEAKACRFG
jgi:hypothetical protein